MPRKPPILNAICNNCKKHIHVLPVRLIQYKKHHCGRACYFSERYSWLGYILEVAGKISYKDMAAHMEVPLNTLLMWISDFRKKEGFKIATPRRPNSAAYLRRKERETMPRKVRPAVVKPVKKPSGRPAKRIEKPEPKKLKTVIRDESAMKYVRVDSKTLVLVSKDIPNQIVIDKYFSRKTG